MLLPLVSSKLPEDISAGGSLKHVLRGRGDGTKTQFSGMKGNELDGKCRAVSASERAGHMR